MTNLKEIKEELYYSLREVLCRVPCIDKLITGGDFNVRVGKVDKWPRVIGLRRVSKCN